MDLAQYLVLDEAVLLDIGTQVGCVCCGAVENVSPGRARAAAVALEPPRSSQLIVEADITIDVRLPETSDDLDPPLVVEAAGS